jgi:hypothetical protein
MKLTDGNYVIRLRLLVPRIRKIFYSSRAKEIQIILIGCNGIKIIRRRKLCYRFFYPCRTKFLKIYKKDTGIYVIFNVNSYPTLNVATKFGNAGNALVGYRTENTAGKTAVCTECTACTECGGQ